MTDRSQSPQPKRFSLPGAWMMVAGSAAGLVASIVYYFWRGNGIAHTDGVLVVIGSTAILLLAALVVVFDTRRHWFTSAFLNVGTCIDILGSGFAAWMLEANWLLGLMCLTALGWLVHVAFDSGARPLVARGESRLQESPQ